MKAKSLRLPGMTDLGAQWGAVALLAFLLLACVRSLLLAIRQPFWFDEVCMIIVCRRSSMAAVWKRLEGAADSAPPVFYMMERVSRHLVADDYLGYRLPAIVGLLLAIACVYFVLSKRTSRLSALAGVAFLLCTQLSDFAADARPYAPMVGCIAFSILAWQRIGESKIYACVLAVALAAAVSLQYYAIFVWPAFIVAEATVWFFEHRFRSSAWVAIAAGAVPFFIFFRLLLRLREYYGQNYFAPPGLKRALFAHDELFNMGGHWGWALAIGLTALLLWPRVGKSTLSGSANGGPREQQRVSEADIALTVVLVWLPLVVFAGARIGHGGMEEQFMLPAVLGGSLAAGFAVERVSTGVRILLLLLLLMKYASVTEGLLGSVQHGTLLQDRIAAVGEVDAIGKLANEPAMSIVIADELEYLPMAYYAPVDSRSRLFAIADPGAIARFSSGASDTAALGLLALQPYFPLQVEDYAGFVSAHRRFLLVTDKQLGQEWLAQRLMQDGDRLTLVPSPPDSNSVIFKVAAGP